MQPGLWRSPPNYAKIASYQDTKEHGKLTEQDKQAIARLRDYYALSSDNETIRFALRRALREIEQPSPAPSHPQKERASSDGAV